MNTRVIEVNNPTTYEAVAPRIEVNWDPVTNTGPVRFYERDMVYVGGEFKTMIGHNGPHRNGPGEQILGGVLNDSIEDLMQSTITVQGVEYPGILLVALIKQRHDDRYAQCIAQQLADAEAQANQPVLTPSPAEGETTTEQSSAE